MQSNITASPIKDDLLELYDKVCARSWSRLDYWFPIKNDNQDMVQKRLKLIGLVRVENNTLQPRNHVYRHVFDRIWIKVNQSSPQRFTIQQWVKSTLSGGLISVILLFSMIYFDIINISLPPDVSNPWLTLLIVVVIIALISTVLLGVIGVIQEWVMDRLSIGGARRIYSRRL